MSALYLYMIIRWNVNNEGYDFLRFIHSILIKNTNTMDLSTQILSEITVYMQNIFQIRIDEKLGKN